MLTRGVRRENHNQIEAVSVDEEADGGDERQDFDKETPEGRSSVCRL